MNASENSSTVRTISQLAREASIELNIGDVEHLDASSDCLPDGIKMYVSHLPKQRWDETVAACRAVRAAGFKPIPHIPVRLLSGVSVLGDLVTRLRDTGVDELLLISGDYARAIGPFTEVAQVLRAHSFKDNGITKISLAGHPEGHPKVSLDVIRRAEREKISLSLQAGLQVTVLTQFFFEAEPFLHWTDTLKAHREDIRIVAGIAGPANSAALFKFALRCGIGPSMRALIANPSAIAKLSRDHGPEGLLCDLAASLVSECRFAGVHLFGFGGFLRTCAWLKKVADGQFRFSNNRFEVLT